MAERQVTHVRLSNPSNPTPYGITALKGPSWWFPAANVINDIVYRRCRYYTYVGYRKAYLEVVNGPSGPYLRTDADTSTTNNLLSLPRF